MLFPEVGLFLYIDGYELSSVRPHEEVESCGESGVERLPQVAPSNGGPSNVEVAADGQEFFGQFGERFDRFRFQICILIHLVSYIVGVISTG